VSPQLSLPADPASVSRARRFVRGALESLGAPAASDDAELLVSELATNALLHARTAFTVEVSRHEDRVRLCVLDASPVTPRVRSFGAESTTGRGLRMVQTLCAAWGVQPQAVGKTVWVELALEQDAGTAAAADEVGEDDGAAPDLDALLAALGEDPDALAAA
jgi:anti-sigma regulatory factor (Ser/Thr protein kinase)